MARPAEVSFDDDPVSTDISTRDFILLYNAFYAANVLGWHLNVAGTIAWYLHYPDQVTAASALAQFLKNYAQWMRDHSYPHATYVYVNENPGNNKFHTHFALHVPKHLAGPFKQWISIHFRKALGFREYAPRFLKMTVRRRPDSKSQWVWLNYMCKGYDPEGALFCSGDGPVRLGDVIMFHREEAGLLEGKGRRYGISRFLYAKQYQKLVEEKDWPAPGIISPLEDQMKSQVLDATQLYAPFPEQAFSPAPSLSYRLRIKEDAARVLEALNLTQLERALGLPLF